jgi:hypothetical protein
MINLPNDTYEQEAEARADKVMRMPAYGTETPFFQPKPCAQVKILSRWVFARNDTGTFGVPLIN